MRTIPSRRTSAACAVLGALVLLATVASVPAPARAEAATLAATTYTNPVSAGVVDSLPDPAMIRAKDGTWYAYGTTNPVRLLAGDSVEHILPVLTSPDMVTWTYAGDVFSFAGRPSWWPSGTRPWAPDIRYVDGNYHLTYSLSGGGIALATAPTPTGPWTDRSLVVTAGSSGCPSGTIDQAMYTDINGDRYLYWGSYDTICVSRLNTAGTALTGAVTQVARGRRMEGGFVVRRDGMYYLFYSDAGCCDGAFSGYAVKVGRASSPLGPFTTPSGVNLMDLTSKDGIVVAATGNGLVGPGHNAIATDLSGQDWLVYHAIRSGNPDFPPVTNPWGGTMNNLSRRPLLIDRLDWINGWPVVRAGAGPSNSAQPAPVTTWTVGSGFNSGSLSGWSGGWSLASETDAHGYLSYAGTGTSYQLSDASIGGDLRVEADLRLGTANTTGAVGLVVSYVDANNNVIAWINRAQQKLVVEARVAGTVTALSSGLPATFDHDSWHNLAVERRGSTLVAWVTPDRLRTAAATVTITLPAGTPTTGRIGAASTGGASAADNLGAVALYQPVTALVPQPVLGGLLSGYSDEFNGSGAPQAADPNWSWVRGPASGATESGGALTWPTQAGELFEGTNTASVLLRDAPSGDFVVETKVQFNGTSGNQQAGIVLYEGDDRYFKLAHSVLPLAQGGGAVLHVTEFAKEGPRPTTTPPQAVVNRPMFGGPATGTVWLRLLYHYDAASNEHDVRMAASTNGSSWTWGGTWSLPRTAAVRIGLVSMNKTGATATFDYLRTYAVTSL
ncbi:family 43 glycosylhydrolase [Catellatospora tritici]|uniref:family 43 glycosylhydrolase n=1 Tax=Catellatospora tritici TaxID=2851566 RepID=UPI001C2D25FB|nr:family 43 glycosylhydrolase [Catellatospora tritici]MBV1856028.1 family 43 glycosylhydrolase [Catellatospora tritici]